MVFFGNPVIEVAIISMVVSTFHKVVQLKFGNQDQMKEHQEKMKKTQEKVKELMQRDDEKARKHREELEREMIDSMNKVMKGTMKVMVVSLIVVLPLFAILGSVYAQEVIDLPVPVPWIGSGFDFLNPLSWVELYNQTNWIGWYVLISLIFSLVVLNPLIKVYTNMKKKGE